MKRGFGAAYFPDWCPNDFNKGGEYLKAKSGFPNVFKAVVISNTTVLSEGKIKVALLHPEISPKSNWNGKETAIEKLHKSTELYNRYDEFIENVDNSQDKSSFHNNIVSCCLGTPYSGSHQNSGYFMCPPVNSKGLVLKILEDYFWICGIFEPIVKSYETNGRTPRDVFLPFPSNIPEVYGIDFEETSQGMPKNNFVNLDSDGLPESGIGSVNSMIVNTMMDQTSITSKDAIVLRVPFSMGTKILDLSQNIDLNTGKLLDSVTPEELMNEYNSVLYPAHFIQEISENRFFIHKAMTWEKSEFPVSMESAKDDLKDTFWIDFSIGNLKNIDKYPSYSEPANSFSLFDNGFGYSIQDTKLKTRTIEYSTINTKHLNMNSTYNDENNNIDVKIDNISGNSTLIVDISNKDKKNINIKIDLSTLNFNLSLLKDSEDVSKNAIEIDSKITVNEDSGEIEANATSIKNINKDGKIFSFLNDAFNGIQKLMNDLAEQSFTFTATDDTKKIEIKQGDNQLVKMDSTNKIISLKNGNNQLIEQDDNTGKTTIQNGTNQKAIMSSTETTFQNSASQKITMTSASTIITGNSGKITLL